jgi:DNA modification methylase
MVKREWEGSEQLKPLLKGIDFLKPDKKNARKHDERNLKAIEDSLRLFGQQKPIVALKDGTVIAGNGTLASAKSLGWKKLAVVLFEDARKARAYAIADNRTGELSSWDRDILVDSLKGIKALDLKLEDIGFLDSEMADLLKEPSSGGYGNMTTSGSLTERFVVPPFSVLDSKAGYWQERKRALLEAMGEIGGTRENALKHNPNLGEIHSGTSLFDPCLADVLLYWFCKPKGRVLDPFAGGPVRGVISKLRGHHYLGIELRKDQADITRKACDKFKAKGSANIITDTSENLLNHTAPETCDMVLTCPPYYDLEVYSKDARDLSAFKTYAQFRETMKRILTDAAVALKPNSFFCIVVSEIRDKKTGVYRNFVGDTISQLQGAGLHFYNDMILLNTAGTAPLRANNLMAARKVVKIHQNILVFYKGNPAEIKKHFPKIETATSEE